MTTPNPTQDSGVSLDVQYLFRELEGKQSGNHQSNRLVPEVTGPQSRQKGWTWQPEDWPEGPSGVWRPRGLWPLPLHTPALRALVHGAWAHVGALVRRACAHVGAPVRGAYTHTITGSDSSAGLMPCVRAHSVTRLPSEQVCVFPALRKPPLRLVADTAG